MSAPPCPNCNGGAALLFRAKDLNRRVTSESFPYYACRSCNLVFLSPIPENLGRFYPADYYGFPSTLEPLAQAAGIERYKIDLVKQFRNGGRLLEVGPGGGGFVYLAKQAGFEVNAIEMSREVCRFLEDIVGIRVVESSDTEKAILAEEPYDVIAAWHVIEHLPNPWATIEAAVARLASGGILVIAAPNPASIQFRVLGRLWAHLDAPRHVQLIPIPVLEERLHALGMRTLFVTGTDEGSLGWNEFGWDVSLRNVLPANSRGIVRRFASKIGRAVTSLLRPIEESGLNGSAYTLVLEKP